MSMAGPMRGLRVPRSLPDVAAAQARAMLPTYLMLGAFIAHVLTLPLLRSLGLAAFLPFLATATAYLAIRRTPLLRDWAALGYLGFGATIVILSFGRVLPSAWTTSFEPSAIFRQAYFIFAFFLLLLAFAQMWAELARVRKIGFAVCLFFFSSAITTVAFGLGSSRGLSESIVPNLTTFGIGLFLGVGYWVARRRTKLESIGAAAGLFALVLALGLTTQTLLAAAVLIMIALVPWRRRVTLALAT